MMHRCLNIVEVQGSIFREVHDQPNGRTTLARLARTCRAFNGAALDSLWAILNSFVCLIRCLPRDLWKIEVVDGKISQTFQRPMSLRDWEIFYRYSSRIRTLRQAPLEYMGEHLNLSDDVIFALSNPPTHGPLVPYLKTLYWDRLNRKYAPLLRLLLTPCLVNLSLSFSTTLHTPEVSVLTCIGTVCPSLKSLRIASYKVFTNFFDARGEKILSDALLHLHSLESLTCPALDEAAIVHLSRLPRLVDLSLELRRDFQLEKVRPLMKPPAFVSVESLTVHAHSLSTLTSLLELMSLQPHTVSFVVANAPTPEALGLFFIALVSTCGSEKLTQISLTSSAERQRNVASQQITHFVFRPLLALSNLQRFTFDAPCDIAFDDNAISTLTKHWPALISLSINAKYGWGIMSRVTHKGLISLLSHCKMLSQFALSVNFTDIDVSSIEVPESRIGGGVSNDECTIATFVTSPIVFPVAIAAFLSDVCPNMDEVRSSCMTMMGDVDLDEVEAYRERWEEVENLLPAFGAVRRQCVNWATRKEAIGAPA